MNTDEAKLIFFLDTFVYRIDWNLERYFATVDEDKHYPLLAMVILSNWKLGYLNEPLNRYSNID